MGERFLVARSVEDTLLRLICTKKNSSLNNIWKLIFNEALSFLKIASHFVCPLTVKITDDGLRAGTHIGVQ